MNKFLMKSSFFLIILLVNVLQSHSMTFSSEKIKFNLQGKKLSDNFNVPDYYNHKLTKDFSDEITVAILGTNDIHGQAFEKITYEYGDEKMDVGGFKQISGIIDKVREEFGKNFLWVDSGDQFTGTVENELTEGTLITDFFNIMKVDAVAIGNHEWDKKENQLRKWMKSELGYFYNPKKPVWSYENYGRFGKFLYLNANIKPKTNEVRQLPNQIPSKIFKLLDGKIKIGIIGLSTLETPYQSTGFASDDFNILDYKEIIEKESIKLRKQGVNAILLLTHVGLSCYLPSFSEEEKEEYYKLKLRDHTYQIKKNCSEELFNLLPNIDINLFDGIIAGHIHESIHHFYKDIPIIQNPMSGIFTNLMYLKFRKNSDGNYEILRNSSLIEGPIPFCSKVYSNNKRCDNYQQLNDGIKIEDYIFHNSKIVPNSKVVDLFENKYKEIKKKILELKSHMIGKTYIKLESNQKIENPLGNFIADILRNSTKADIGIMSTGGIRYTFEVGPISEYSLNNMFPFKDIITKVKISGKNLKEVIRICETDINDFYPISGLKIKLSNMSDGKLILSDDDIILDNGDKIIDNKVYELASTKFLLTGGDKFFNFKTSVPDGKLNMTIFDGPLEGKLHLITEFRRKLIEFGDFTEEKAKNLLGRLKIDKISN